MDERHPTNDSAQYSAALDAELIDAARREVEGADKPGGSNGVTLNTPGPTGPVFTGPPPDSFTGYKIVRQIHRGGQGVVYQAIQESTKRKVAIKVMKEGPFAGSADRARFDREVHVLGQLNHPNIVAIHDTGSAAGSFYFVMDYISGQPLDVYMASGERSIDETLELFGKICQAINAAHLRGIIHRDLKPGNIRIDAEGEPHVLDFGLAKVATSDAEASMMTMTGQFIGSLPWASPEQAEGAPGKIDVRTDVYSLGVILYQMLTGKFPYEVIGNMRDVLDRIMQAEPTRPSTIRKQINDEVETLVLKCLAKERSRRYQTAGELGRDIEHYLRGEPIEAKRDSAFYVLRKTLRRYRAAAVVVGSFLLLLGVLAVMMSFMYAEQRRLHEHATTQAAIANEERDNARTATEVALTHKELAEQRLRDVQVARELAETRLREVEAARDEAERQAQIAQAVLDFLNVDVLSAFDPTRFDVDLSMEERLDAASERIDHLFHDTPRIGASIRNTLARLYLALDAPRQAETHLHKGLEIQRRAQPENRLELAADRYDVLAKLFMRAGNYAAAKVLYSAALDVKREVHGDDHLGVADTLNGLVAALVLKDDLAAAIPVLQEEADIRRELQGADHPDVADRLEMLALLQIEQGDYAAAESAYRAVLESRRQLLGNDHPDLVATLLTLAYLRNFQGDADSAELLSRESLAIVRKAYGSEHEQVANTLIMLGFVLMGKEDSAAATPVFSEVLRIRRQLVGDEHPDVQQSITMLGALLCHQGDYARAEPLCREAVAISRKLHGGEHPLLAESLQLLAKCLSRKGDYAEAMSVMGEALAIERRIHGDGHLDVLGIQGWMAVNMIQSWIMPEGEPPSEAPSKPIQIEMAEFTVTDFITGSFVERAKGKTDAEPVAEPLFREALAVCREVNGDRHPAEARIMTSQAGLLLKAGNYAQAEQLLREALELQRRALGNEDPDTLATMSQLVALYEAWGNPEQAAEWRARLPTTQPASVRQPVPTPEDIGRETHP